MKIAITSLDILTGVFAFIAAYVWFKSAKVQTPDSFSIYVARPYNSPLGDNPLNASYMGQGYSEDLTNLGESLSKQSKLSAKAATVAALAAIFQAASIIIKLFE
jgi:hypothetical protein